jgi:DNA polymerase elongation subunit (family B)
MMSDFMYHEVPKMPWISGWNFLKFDWAYINRRCKNIGVDYTKASPTGTMEKMSFKDKYDKSKRWYVELPKHRAIVDYQMVYEKWDTVVKFKENASLDAVAKEVLGYEKVKYPGSLSEFYESDYEGFIFYNMVDTILVSLIDKKIATFNTMFAIANGAGIQLNDAQFTSVGVEAKLQKEFTTKGIVLVPRAKGTGSDEEESYSGGYVYEPEIGIHEKAFIVDYASMFPSILMAFNIGTDSLVGLYDQEIGKIKNYKGQWIEFDPIIHIKSTYGTVFDKTSDSSLRSFIANTINERLEAKPLNL